MGTFLRIIRTAWYGFTRNGWLSFVATFMMMQTLLLITIFISLNVVVNQAIQSVNDRIDVAIFFKEYIPQSDVLAFKDKINSINGVKNIIFISQEQALKSYIAQNQDNQELLNVIGDDSSFLPSSLEIKVTDPYLIESIVEKVKTMDIEGLISETSLKKNQNVIDQLRKINKLVSWANISLSFIFIIIALLIIFNTIRITIFTRREEIEIMQLVGATDWYIRWPFIIEGMIYGVVGAVLAFIVTLLGYWFIISNISNKYFSIDVTATASGAGLFNIWLVVELFALQILLGMLVGGLSSYLSTRRHLRI